MHNIRPSLAVIGGIIIGIILCFQLPLYVNSHLFMWCGTTLIGTTIMVGFANAEFSNKPTQLLMLTSFLMLAATYTSGTLLAASIYNTIA